MTAELGQHALEVLEGRRAVALEAVADGLDHAPSVVLQGLQVERALAAERVVQALAADAELSLQLGHAEAVVAAAPEQVARAFERGLGVELLGGSGAHGAILPI